MWNVFSLTVPLNKEKKLDLLINKSRFPLDYMKRHVHIFRKALRKIIMWLRT